MEALEVLLGIGGGDSVRGLPLIRLGLRPIHLLPSREKVPEGRMRGRSLAPAPEVFNGRQ